jgi:hypothetical protein
LRFRPTVRWLPPQALAATVAVIDRKARTLARTLVGPGLPVWSVGVPAR